MRDRVLAFDFGLMRIGVAVGNRRSLTANALTTLTARDGVPDWEALGKLLQEWQPERLLVGLPLNMDDSESEMSGRARRFANRLRGRFGLPVELVDERLTTRSAREKLREAGISVTRSRDSIDKVSAKRILDDWLNQQSAGDNPGEDRRDYD